MTLAMMLATTMMVAVEAAIVMDGDMDVDILEGGLTCLRLPPSLSKPYDPPYPMQPYAIKPLQFHSFMNYDTTPYKFPTVSAGDGAMGRGMPCQGHGTMVRLYNGMMYDVQRYDVRPTTVQCTTYNGTMYDLQRYNVRRTTARHMTYDIRRITVRHMMYDIRRMSYDVRQV